MGEIEELMKLLRDKALNNSVRLGILLALYYVGDYMTFNDLWRSLGIPKSTLHKHLTILKDAGLIEYRRGITIIGVRTIVRLTDEGKAVVRKYLELVSRLDHGQ